MRFTHSARPGFKLRFTISHYSRCRSAWPNPFLLVLQIIKVSQTTILFTFCVYNLFLVSHNELQVISQIRCKSNSIFPQKDFNYELAFYEYSLSYSITLGLKLSNMRGGRKQIFTRGLYELFISCYME